MGSKNKAERSCCDDNYGLNREEQNYVSENKHITLYVEITKDFLC